MNTPTPTPREVRHRLNQMERYVMKNTELFSMDIVRLRGLFELAYKPEHVDYLAEQIRVVSRRLESLPA